MNGLVRKYKYQMIEKLEDQIKQKEYDIACMEQDLDDMRKEVEAEEAEQAHRDYEGSV